MVEEYVIGIDVGTGSARAGIFDLRGNLVSRAQHEIMTWYPGGDFAEQSSEDIWKAVCSSIKKALSEKQIAPETIAGISFDATCSLVALGPDDEPITVSNTQSMEQNIIVWMDHRAIGQAEKINRTGHEVLRYVGGKISPEQEPPKLLWIKENLPSTWANAEKFMDLADFLTYRSSGIDVRSVCTSVCKWTYLAHEQRWDKDFFDAIGLGELFSGNKLGDDVLMAGHCIGTLTENRLLKWAFQRTQKSVSVLLMPMPVESA